MSRQNWITIGAIIMLVIPCIILGIWQKDRTNKETKSEVVSLMSKNTEPVNECILIQRQDSTIKLLGRDAEAFKRDVQNSVLKKTLVNMDMPYALKIIMDDELSNVIYANYDKTNNAIYYDSKNDCVEHIKTLTLSIDESVACGADVALVPEENLYYKYIMVNEEREEQANGIMYKSERMGISFIIPNNWKGKYRIDEVEDGLWVHFTLMDSVNEDPSDLHFGQNDSITNKILASSEWNATVDKVVSDNANKGAFSVSNSMALKPATYFWLFMQSIIQLQERKKVIHGVLQSQYQIIMISNITPRMA